MFEVVDGTGVLAGDGELLPMRGDPTAWGCISPVTSFFVIEETAHPAQVSEDGVDGVAERAVGAPLGLSLPVSTIAESGMLSISFSTRLTKVSKDLIACTRTILH